MASDKLKIANMALAKIGARAITSFNQSGSNEARAINEVYDDILDEVLCEAPWGHAQKRVALSYIVPDDTSRTINGRVYTPVTITGATADEPVVITAASHGLGNGDRIKIIGVVGMTQLNGNFYIVKNVTTNTFELTDEDNEEEIDGDSYTTYVSGGQIYFAPVGFDPIMITAATAANPVVITSAAHGLADGDWVKIQGVLGMTNLNSNFYIVDNVTTNTFSLQNTDEEDINGLLYGAYTSGGQILIAEELVVVDSGEAVVYQKPTDYVKLIKKSDSSAIIRMEEDKIISNFSGLKIIYTFRNVDVRQYPQKFIQALVTRLAAEICFRITTSMDKTQALLKLYQDTILPSAVSIDSTTGSVDEPLQDEWLSAQIRGSGNWPATTGETWHPVF